MNRNLQLNIAQTLSFEQISIITRSTRQHSHSPLSTPFYLSLNSASIDSVLDEYIVEVGNSNNTWKVVSFSAPPIISTDGAALFSNRSHSLITDSFWPEERERQNITDHINE